MTMLNDLVAQTLADPLAAARAHVAAGGRAIGLLGWEVPVELVLAAGAFPVQLGALTPRPTPGADAYLESGFNPATRLVLEAWLAGDLDMLSAVILPRASDNAQRLYYYACELQRSGRLKGPEPVLFDLAKVTRETSRDHSRAATAALAARIGAGEPTAGIARMNRRRALFARLAAQRHSWAGSVVEQLLRAAGCADGAPFDVALAAALDAEKRVREGPRLLLVGSAPPDDRLHRAVEAAGGTIIAELHEAGLDRHGPAIDAGIDAIADALRALPFGPRAFADRAEMAAAAAQAVDGVIFWLIEEEEALIWDLPAQVRAVEALHRPTLILTRASWVAGEATLGRITHFTRTLGGAA